MSNNRTLDDTVVSAFLTDVSRIKELEQSLRTETNQREITVMTRSAYGALSIKYGASLDRTPEGDYLNSLLGFMNTPRISISDLRGLTPILDVHIKELEMSVRTEHFLYASQIEYVGELVQLTVADLLRKKCPKKYLTEITEILEERGLGLGIKIEYVRPELRSDNAG